MIRTKNRKGIRLNKLAVTEAINGGDEGVRVKVRATFDADLTEKELSKLPQVAKAAKALLKSSIERSEDEGADSVNMTLKFKFETLRYVFSDLPGGANVSMDGSVVNRPRVSVVKGNVGLRWIIETTIALDDLKAMAAIVQDEDGCCMTSVGIQIQLPLKDAA